MTAESPSDRELEALKALWQRGKATVRELCETIGAGDELAYTTVLSLLQTMEQKGLVGHERQGKAYVYFAKIERNRTLAHLAGAFTDRVFDGAIDEYLLHILDARGLNREEIERLEKLIEAAKKTKSRGKRKGSP